MNRNDFQQLAEIRIDEAAALLAAKKWDGAYYLAGYAVECALKACIAKLTREHDFPPERTFVESWYTHAVSKLVESANLAILLKTDMKADVAFAANWGVVSQWKEISRYGRKTQPEAEMLYNAITDPAHGVLQWLRRHW